MNTITYTELDRIYVGTFPIFSSKHSHFLSLAYSFTYPVHKIHIGIYVTKKKLHNFYRT